jgi:hypothetical protein
VVGLGWFPLPVHSNGCGFESMVVTRTFSDRRTDDQTMAAGASVTWTHCSVLFEVTWDKTTSVRADTTMRPRGRTRIRADMRTSTRTHPNVCADIGASARMRLCVRVDEDEVISLPLPSLCTPSLALRGQVVASARTREKIPNS